MKRRGIALLSALVALVLTSLAMVALFHLAVGESRRARSDVHGVQAAAAADGGLLTTVRDWPTNAWDTLRVGDTLPAVVHRFASARAVVQGMRISEFVWHVVSSGESGDSAARTLARRRVNALFRLAVPDLPVEAALTARDSVSLRGSALVVGADSSGGIGGVACPPGSPGAAVATPDTTAVCDGSCAQHSGIRALGAPALLQDTLAGDSLRYLRFGAEDWALLTAHAHAVLPAGIVVTPAPQVTQGRCDPTVGSNWGDPTGVSLCASHAPLIWARGDLEVRGGAGQGLLLVDGDLTLSQGARFVGVVITRDDLMSGSGGGSIVGLTLAADLRKGPGDHTTLADGVRIQLGRCAVDGVLRRSARLVPVVSRWWATVR
jgi:hypothetical protein